MLTWIVVFIVFGILILVHEAGHLFAAKKAGIAVEAFSIGMGKRLFGIKIGGTDYRISLFPFGGYCQMAGEDPREAEGKECEFGSKPVGYRFWVVVAGSLVNYLFAFVLFSIIFMIGVPTLSNEVGQILKGYPAEKAGMRTGDKILFVSGEKVEYWEDIVAAIKEKTSDGTVLDIRIMRDGRRMNIAVKPDIQHQTNIFGQTVSRPMIGIAPENKILSVSYDPVRAVYFGGRKLVSLTVMTYKGLWLLVTGSISLKTSAVGPIGIAFFMRNAAQMGIVHLLFITAYISMALAIFNLLPFPVLDGGHIIFLALEKLRGRPLNIKIQEVITNIAIVMIIAFALFVSWQDILKFTPLGKRGEDVVETK